MGDLKNILQKQGGFHLIQNYIKSGVFFLACIQLILLGKSKKALEILRLIIQLKLKMKFEKKYKKFIVEFKKNHDLSKLNHEHSDIIWFCWLQGIDNAPKLVQTCFYSLKKHIKDRKIILLTIDNYKDYVTFPDYIQEKINKGIISKTHMSDLLRLELLIKYGGTWIDSTVYCTGGDIPDYIFDSDLFLFQCLKPGLDGHVISISSWFITSYTNHPILLMTRDLLYSYWAKYNYVKEYFIFHLFFQLAIEAYPDEWKSVIPYSNSIPHILLLRLFEKYNEEVWNEITRISPFHKLTYKFEKTYNAHAEFEMENTYYKKIVNE